MNATFLGEFELSGIPPSPKNESRIETTFKIDSNGILSVNASYGSMQKSLKLDVYSKSGGMTDKTIERLSLRLNKLMIPDSKNQLKCDILEDATRMSVIPKKRNKSNVLKLYVESEVKLTPLESSIYPYLGFILVKLCHIRTQGYHMIIIIIIIIILIVIIIIIIIVIIIINITNIIIIIIIIKDVRWCNGQSKRPSPWGSWVQFSLRTHDTYVKRFSQRSAERCGFFLVTHREF